MKTLPVLLLLMLAACGHKQMSKDDLSGSYARAFRSEYAVGTDTLQFSKASDDTYRIKKVTNYHRIKNGVMADSVEHHEEHWLGVYDKGHAVVRVLPSGKVISVDVQQNEILLGSNIYKRIDE